MLAKFWIGLAAVFGLFFLFLVTIVSNSRFTMPHPRDRSVKMLLTDRGAVLMPHPGAKQGALAQTGTPQVEIVEPVFHFGRMEPQTTGKHSFEVRNSGTAPLTLDVAGTTCKCTIGGVSAHSVPPGESTFVTLEWNTGYKFQTYSQSAEVRTNDPRKPVFSLAVEGRVRRLFGAESEELVVPAVTPGKTATADMIVYSQTWEDFEIVDIKTTLPGIAVQVLPSDDKDAERLDAKSSRVLRVTVPGDLPPGEFRDAIRLKAAPTSAPQDVAEFELPVRGKTLKRFTINGPFNEKDALLIGQVPSGVGKTLRLLVKLRDEDLNLPVKSIEATPSFLKVAVEPHVESGAAVTGLYDILIEVPANAPACQYMGNPMGCLRITTGHPRVPEIKLQVLLAVTL